MFPSLRALPFVLGVMLAAPLAAHAQTAPACQFTLGFKTLHDLDPQDIGDCTDNQASAPNGDAQQHTTKGLMVWRKADNWTAFTNGYTTWINGPNGLVSRLNSDRFPWEAAAPSAPSSPSPSQGSTAAGQASGAGAQCVTTVNGTVKHDLGPFYMLNVHATDAKGAGVPGLQGSFTVNYEDGYWPLYDVTDANGDGWNDWVVTATQSPVTITVTVVGGGCTASTQISFPLTS
jgi:hypothetical protein